MSITEGLNPQQLDAVKSCNGNIFLAAGPGSGKTHTMTKKILYLTEELNISPSSILVITFAKEAAVNMQNRFVSMSSRHSPVVFGTFHSVFYHMISEHLKPAEVRILFDKNQRSIAESTIKNICKNSALEITDDLVNGFLYFLSVYKNSLDEKKSLSSLPDPLKPFSKDLFRYYEKIRKRSSLTSFDDMVYDCRKLLINDSRFRSEWVGRFKYILIDEFQDINPVQYETVCLLTDKNTCIFAVGDDDQSIYGFRGSDPSIIGRFLEEKNAKLMHLDTNFRSYESIVTSSLKVININKNRIKKDLISFHEEKGKVEIRSFPDKNRQYLELEKLIKAMPSPGKCAILFRTNIDMQTFASYLTSRGVNFYIREKQANIFDHFIFRAVISYLRLSAGTESEDDLKEIINLPPRFISRELILASKGNLDKLACLVSEDPYGRNRSSKKEKIMTLKNDLNFMKNRSLLFAVKYLYHKMGFEKYIMSKAGETEKRKEEYRQILDMIPEIISGNETLTELEELGEEYTISLRKDTDENQKQTAIKLMTVHASKGLEFDTVIIPGCNEGSFPHGKILSEESVEEERRIFYVAMTRARENLLLFYISSKDNSKYIPSRFLNPLLK